MNDAALTAEQAHAIYDLLIRHAEANEHARDSFIYHQTAGRCDEYRFMGSLGFGGKFWRTNRRWYVTAYPEDIRRRPSIQDAINVTNAALSGLLASYRAVDAALAEDLPS